jgi:hypothetical protein
MFGGQQVASLTKHAILQDLVDQMGFGKLPDAGLAINRQGVYQCMTWSLSAV